ncbi:MAG: deoxyribodipyrimidine photo-lyase, partial [Candidatus Micrarchaeota archaeon]|nr:deoxyribodipyrimidine photo-lyase [Candidatus Micrarchaeota archaeon]
MYKNRIQDLNQKQIDTRGEYILYMMHASQRINFNYALNYAILLANQFNKPLVVAIAIEPDYLLFSSRHYYFMLQGLIYIKKELEKLGITFLSVLDNYVDVCRELAENAVQVVTDVSYLRKDLNNIHELAKKIDKKLQSVEDNVVVPVKIASSKAEPYARTIRPKLLSFLNEYLNDYNGLQILENKKTLDLDIDLLDLNNSEDIVDIIKRLTTTDTKECSKFYYGGYEHAKKLLHEFTENKLKYYSHYRNVPSKNYSSNLSPYLRFGQISAHEILLTCEKDNKLAFEKNKYSLINELIVWRELARNFVYYENQVYDSHKCIPEWAVKEFEKHANDKREYIYDLDTLEKGVTHDKLWNAAQKELTLTGKIHNYVRMYWGKKVLEWTDNYVTAFNYLVYLNDKYALDGSDPNSYLSIAWIFGKFDRPFYQDRPIIGKI